MTSPAPLIERLRATIRRDGPISFARFMEAALYDPEHGYYARGTAAFGPSGDFVTAGDVGRAFGACMARQIVEVDTTLGPFAPFVVVEFGAGRGRLARDVIDALGATVPELARRTRYRMTDRSAAMLAAARREVPEAEAWPADELPRGGCGVVLAVELFDALPVHRLRRRGAVLVEVGVGIDAAGALIEVEGDAAPEAAELAERYGAASREGMEAEVATGVADQLRRMADAIERGLILVVDYGDRADRLFAPERSRGTLLAYHRHATNEEFLLRIGEQDLTAHVNFSHLEDAAREAGLAVLGFTTQDRFLIQNGILETFDQRDVSESRDPVRVKQRLQAMQLIHPEAMGRRFKVLALAKGFVDPPHLRALDDPFERDRL